MKNLDLYITQINIPFLAISITQPIFCKFESEISTVL